MEILHHFTQLDILVGVYATAGGGGGGGARAAGTSGGGYRGGERSGLVVRLKTQGPPIIQSELLDLWQWWFAGGGGGGGVLTCASRIR